MLRAVLGEPIEPAPHLTARWPELAEARFRHGGLPPRLGGWLLGASAVAGIALGRRVWLATARAAEDPALLLHEVRHVQQFATVPGFAWRYVWQTLRHGYTGNRFEIDARDYAARRLAEAGSPAAPGPPAGAGTP